MNLYTIQLMMSCILIYHKEIDNGMVAMDKFAYIRVADVVAVNEELARLRAEVADLKEKCARGGKNGR